ncbi:hypothetical protein EMIHUDRAFT_209143 [Emiliania huxleyi CCMP1516]|uniref:CST complex subunit Stn1 N-terminal domain-containing protein n=2 Tax=Emiliania huxleyi TaxID=2903 RepID=A0A0D3J7R6_EMIH1|nr:hypothetical protein EMIHUDRAFT_209143 [Emiliania huxleyi CCMP1516]EOD19551.1 hypothetical protein EMIHUDRAFT_209143 [Emiliania huxleyi CCMP1516]|eukprot:XP_005771980.1 hypothetical protein EMIHUDRAFT_209143 [Emiliania huxleyi CCMP1516]
MSIQRRTPPAHWGSDPTYHAYAKVLVAQALTIALANEPVPREGGGGGCGQHVWWLGARAVHLFSVCGVVVESYRRDSSSHFMIDDSTGLLPCIWWDGAATEAGPSRQPRAAPPLGACLHVHGSLSYFRESRQLRVDCAWPEPDPLGEPLHWAEAQRMWEATYHRAFRYPGAAVAPQSAPAGLAEGAVEPAAGAVSGEAAALAREEGRAGAVGVSLAELRKSVRAGGWQARLADLEPSVERLVEGSLLYVAHDGGPAGRDRLYRPVGP